MSEDWTSKELSEEAGVTRRWINELCSIGEDGPFPGATKRANAWFIPYDEGKEWLDAHLAEKETED